MTDPENVNPKTLNRIRGLMEKANRTDSEEEADAFRAHAMKLMAAHGIQQAMLEATGQKTADTITKIRVSFQNPYSYEKHNLLRGIAVALGCKTLMYPKGKSVLATDVVGHSSDLERVEFLYTLLLVQSETGAAKLSADSYGGYYTGTEVAARTRHLRASYMAGFSATISERLTEIAEHATRQNQAEHTAAGDGAPGTALVLASRMELVENKFKEYFPKTGQRKSRTYNMTGYGAGQAGGRRADLNQTRFGARKALAQ